MTKLLHQLFVNKDLAAVATKIQFITFSQAHSLFGLHLAVALCPRVPEESEYI